jgi:hypothetical protein
MQQETFQIGLICQQCSSKLFRIGADEPKSDDMVICPVHGRIGSYHEVTKAAETLIVGQFSDAIENMLTNAGFQFTKS